MDCTVYGMHLGSFRCSFLFVGQLQMVRFIESNAVNMFPLVNKLFDVDVCLRATQNSQIVTNRRDQKKNIVCQRKCACF